MLRAPFHDWVWTADYQGFAEVLPVTGWAAFKLWTFWGLTIAIGGLTLLRIDPKLGMSDSLIGGAAATWIFAYIAGNLLGPVGLFRSWTIWPMAIAAVVLLARSPSQFEIHPLSIGQKLALLACALMVIGMLPVELGSPVTPYMDSLNTPSSTQRILTFGKYLPFDNDPYGYWTPATQTPATELLYAFLGLGAHLPLGVLAVTAAMVPMAGLMLLATYRLGRAMMGDVAGGFAALLLLAGTLLTRVQGMRTAVAFVLVAIGLAFFMDPDRRPIRTAIGALALGTALAAHAINGGMALATAGGILLIRFLDDDPWNVLLEAGSLFGGLLVALPEFAVALQIKAPYPALSICQLVGVTIVWLAVRKLPPRPARRPKLTDWSCRLMILAGFIFLASRAHGIPDGMSENFPLLFICSLAGLATAMVWGRPRVRGLYVAAMALLIAGVAQHLIESNLFTPSGAQAQWGLQDVVFKLDEYWAPYFLAFPAAALFDWTYSKASRWLTIAALLALVIFPWRQNPNLDVFYYESPLAVQWARNLLTAKTGWWGNSPDHRWVQSPQELKLSDVLRGEIKAGRITMATHIVHVTPQVIIWQDNLLHSVFTGVNDDIYVINPVSDLSTTASAGSRTKPTTELPAALAKHPPYIVVFRQPPSFMSLPPEGYQKIFGDNDNFRLYRRDDLEPKSMQTAR